MWDQSLAAELPAPRNDEPESLRADIVDEIADHLSCALARELHHQNETSARRYVIERFGNPTHIARRLWWDAMKERIMSQRITATMAAIAAAACIAGCFFLWQMMQQGQQAQASMMAAQQEFTQALLERLEALGGAADEEVDPRYAGWAPVSLQLVDSADGTTPVSGSAVISGGPFGVRDPNNAGQDEVRRSAETDAVGRIDLGTVPLGKYSIEINCDANGGKSHRSLILGPEGYEDVVVLCPVTQPEPAEVSFEFMNLPESLKDVLFDIDVGVQAEDVDGYKWYRGDSYHSLLVRGDGTIVGGMRYQRTNDYGGSFPFARVTERQAEIVAAPKLTAEKYFLTHLQALSANDAVEQGAVVRFVELHGEEFRDEKTMPTLTLKPGVDNFWSIELPSRFDQLVEADLLRLGVVPPPEGMVVSMPTLRGEGATMERTAIGDRVNLFVTVPSETSGNPPDSVLIAESIRVLSNDEDERYGGRSTAGRTGTSRMALLVPEDVAEALQLGSYNGRSLYVELATGSSTEPVGHVTPELLEKLRSLSDRSRSRPTSSGFDFDRSRFERSRSSEGDDS